MDGDVSSLWSYQQESIDELKHKLLYTDLELETTRMKANEERRKLEDHIKHLLNLLKHAYQERDEAKTQLKNLQSKITPTCPPQFHAISSNSESNTTFSDTLNNYYESSPMDSLFDVVSSTRQPSLMNLETQDCGEHDKASVLINNLAKNKVLPKQGKLLEAVMNAGPLLQTLLVAGPLPRWRNTPPPLQSFKIPHVVSDNVMIQSHLNNNNTSSPYVEMNYGPSTPIFNLSDRPGFGFDGEFSVVNGKRPRFH